MNRKMMLQILATLFAVSIIVALASCGDDPAPTPMPTATPQPDVVVVPTATAEPTSTPVPAVTPEPTATPEPTSTPTPEPEPTATPEPTVVSYPAVPGIVDVANRAWPREVELPEGVVKIEEPPQRILAYSLGHDEILLALVHKDRFAAIGPFTGDPAYSNVAEHVEGLPTFESGVENVLAAEPDLVVVSKYTDTDVVDLINEAGVPVVRVALDSSAQGNIPNILFMGYILGVEERALELVAEIEGRLALVSERVPPVGDPKRPAVISISRYSDSIYSAGGGTTEGGIIEAAGGVNAAARDGIESHQTIGVESIASMNPDVILIAQPIEYGANEFRDDLLAHPALANVSAVANNQVHVVDSRKFTTLSYWNVRGIEEAAILLYPDSFSDVTFRDFEPYSAE